jgi:hypothetical protein
MKPARFVFFLFIVISVAVPALAWGPVGHRVVAAVAESQLTPQAKAKARALNGGAPLTDIAVEADDIRNGRPETKPWHFVDIEITDNTYDEARDCAEDDCVVARIEQFKTQLANKNLSKAKRREALMFLVHFVGDVHQPLHSSDNHDRGGNDTKVRFGQKSRALHSIWDSGILDLTGTESGLISDLKQTIAQGVPAGTADGDAEDWANESHKAGQAAYKQILNDHRLSGPEVTEDEKVVKRQLLRASVRLAKALNEALQ